MPFVPWITWKFGELFYSRSKTNKQFKQISAIFKWMSAMFKIRTVIFTESTALYPRTLLLQLANKDNPFTHLASSDFRCKGTLLRYAACDVWWHQFSERAPAHATLDCPRFKSDAFKAGSKVWPNASGFCYSSCHLRLTAFSFLGGIELQQWMNDLES